MSTIQFLAEWAVRSSVLVLAGAVVLLLLRVKDSSIRLATWVALLCGSVALPLMTAIAATGADDCGASGCGVCCVFR